MVLDPATYRTHLADDVLRVRDLAADGDLDLAVPTCPGWTVGDVLDHLAGVFRFATAQLLAPPRSSMAAFDPPPADLDPVTSFTESAAMLTEALDRTDPDEHRPNWAGEPTAAFYWRRMAQELAMHRADVELAQGRPVAIDPALAADGIDELAEVFLPHAAERGITGTGETVHFHATDDDVEGGEWTFTFTAEGVDVARIHGKADMAAKGPASDLLLLAWNRGPTGLQVFGDPDVTQWWPAQVRI